MRKYIDSVLTKYIEYMEKYDHNPDAEIVVEWDALIICLYLAVLPVCGKAFKSSDELLGYLEEFMHSYYAEEDKERSGMVRVTGYMFCEESGISCFSIYSLYVYTLMREADDKECFYRTMILFPFLRECSWGTDSHALSSTVQKYLSGHPDIIYDPQTGQGDIQNSREFRDLFGSFIRLWRYDQNVSAMEITNAESESVEAYFMYSRREGR